MSPPPRPTPATPESAQDIPSRLCLQCGLCCNGVLFKDVKLQSGDKPRQLAGLGLPIQRSTSRSRPGKPVHSFPQPCAALDNDCRCNVYSARPSRCRTFECALFLAVRDGRKSIPDALRVVRRARQQADVVRKLLRDVGDAHEQTALSVRFRRTQDRFELHPPDKETAGRYAALTLAVQDLNVLLGTEFFP